MALSRNLGVGVVKVEVDFKYLRAELGRVQRMIRSLPTERLKVRIAMGPLRQDLQRIGASLQRAQRWTQKPWQVRIDTSNARMEIRRLREQLKQLRQGGGGHVYPTRVPGSGGGGGGGGGSATSFFLRSGMFGRAGMAAGGAMDFAGGAARFGASGIVGGVAGAGALAGGAAAAGTIGFGVKLNADVEIYKNSLKVILKDQAKANKLFKELQKIDLDLPVDIGMLAENAQKLAGAGFDPSKIGGMLRTVADAAAISPVGTEEGSARIVKALTQIRAKRDLQMEDLNQLSELGIPVRQLINDQFGMTAQQVGDKVRSGEMSIDDVLEQILESFDKMFGGALEERAKTFYGAIDQIADRFRAFSRDISTPIFDKLKGALERVTEAMKSEDFQNFTLELTTSMRELAEIASKAADAIKYLYNIADEASGKGKEGPGFLSTMVFGSAAAGAIKNIGDQVPGQSTTGKVNFGLGAANVAIEEGLITSGINKLVGKAFGAAGYANIEKMFNKVSNIDNPTRMMTRMEMVKAESNRDYTRAYKLAEQTGDQKAMERFRPLVTDEFEKELKQREQEKEAAKSVFEFGAKIAPKLTPSGIGEMLGGVAGNAIPYLKTGRTAIKGMMEEPIEAMKGFTSDIAAGMQKGRFEEQFRQNVDFMASENPEIAEALKNTEFQSRLVRNAQGKLVTEFGIGKLGTESKMESPQFTDFGNLNKMIQGQIDQARMEEHAKKTAEKAQELVDIMNGQTGVLEGIKGEIGKFAPVVQEG